MLTSEAGGHSAAVHGAVTGAGLVHHLVEGQVLGVAYEEPQEIRSLHSPQLSRENI